jgi:cytochrome c553
MASSGNDMGTRFGLHQISRTAIHVAVLSTLAVTVASPAPAASGAQAARAEFLEASRLTPDASHGEKLFETCAACHGRAGLGAPDGSVPAIAGQHGSVLLKQLVDFRHEQRWDERMEHFSDRHHLPAAQDLTDVAAYASKLPRFPATADSIGDGAFLQAGASVYFQECEACHGPLGQGDVLRLRPRLAGQHYEYLLGELTQTATGLRPGMDPAHIARLKKLTPEQIKGVADYLSRVSPDLSSHPRTDVR